jgi:hypothetical protein
MGVIKFNQFRNIPIHGTEQKFSINIKEKEQQNQESFSGAGYSGSSDTQANLYDDMSPITPDGAR